MMEKVERKKKNGRSPWWDEDVSVRVKPQKEDVLCGRGRTAFEHEGNRVLRVAIARNLPSFSATKARTEKSKIVRSIIKDVLDRGGRFLKRTRDKTDAWHVVGFVHARERVSHALRDAAADKVRSMPPSRVSKTSNVADQKKAYQEELSTLQHTPSTTMKPASPVTQSACFTKGKIERLQRSVRHPPGRAPCMPSVQEKRPSALVDTFIMEFGEENHSLNSDILDFYNDLAISDIMSAEDTVSSVDVADALLDSPLRTTIMIGETL